ncbi:MAG: hypothetical protein SGILL_001721, partial [Bacillariaceae sp.]
MGAWMDSLPSSSGLRSSNCRDDLQEIASARREFASKIVSKTSYAEAWQCLDHLHKYYHYLLECEEKGLTTKSSSRSNSDGAEPFLVLEWQSALTSQIQSMPNSLEWDRSGLIWNMVALQAHEALQQSLKNDKSGWNKAAVHLQMAASWLQYLPEREPHAKTFLQPATYPDFSHTFVELWQSLLCAQSQRCVYEALACGPRQKHVLLAKLAAAAVPLFSQVELIVRNDDESAAPSLTPFSGLVVGWAEFARAWGMFMSCKAEFHQSQISREKKEWGLELARLDVAYQYADVCKQYCFGQSAAATAATKSVLTLLPPGEGILHELKSLSLHILKDLKERVDMAEQEGHNQPVPSRQELAEIRGEKVVKCDQPISKLLKPKKTDPIFQRIQQGPDVQLYIEMFDTKVDKKVGHITDLAEDCALKGKQALADVNLPHSIQTYLQEQQGNGFPQALWERVEAVQREKRIAQLKQNLWELRDNADTAKSTFANIQNQLDFDLDSDRLFRKDNPFFEGHDAEEVQKEFRMSLQNLKQLLDSAQSGDAELLKQLDQLDTNPKYKLLQFQKSQLDLLVPNASSGAHNQNLETIDTSQLSRLLVELSRLFDDRELALSRLHKSVKEFDIHAALESEVSFTKGTDEEFRAAIEKFERSFDGLIQDVQSNTDQQSGLMDKIFIENDKFRIARGNDGAIQSGDSCIAMIDNAIDEIDDLSDHLHHGKDFYGVIIPKLDKLKNQVEDVSARLTIERLEYDDSVNRTKQEEKDAMMAQKMSSDNPSASGEAIGGASGHADGVDDEKVAILLNMDFDPAKVVAALKKHNNNVDQALNELL